MDLDRDRCSGARHRDLSPRRRCVTPPAGLYVACALLAMPWLAEGQTVAAPPAASPLAGELATLDRQMESYIAAMEKTVADLAGLRDSVEKEYAASGDPVLLARRNQIDERLVTMRRSVSEAKAARAQLLSAGHAP